MYKCRRKNAKNSGLGTSAFVFISPSVTALLTLSVAFFFPLSTIALRALWKQHRSMPSEAALSLHLQC